MAQCWQCLRWRVPVLEDANKLGRAQRGEAKTTIHQENLRSEGNGERQLREDLSTVLRGIIVLQRVLHVHCRKDNKGWIKAQHIWVRLEEIFLMTRLIKQGYRLTREAKESTSLEIFKNNLGKHIGTMQSRVSPWNRPCVKQTSIFSDFPYTLFISPGVSPAGF